MTHKAFRQPKVSFPPGSIAALFPKLRRGSRSDTGKSQRLGQWDSDVDSQMRGPPAASADDARQSQQPRRRDIARRARADSDERPSADGDRPKQIPVQLAGKKRPERERDARALSPSLCFFSLCL